ncbi:MAG: hypothetical protein ACJ8F2_19295 [Xanthobacteraceae bacterium]
MDERVMRFALRETVEIEPAFDQCIIFGKTLPQPALERGERRRASFFSRACGRHRRHFFRLLARCLGRGRRGSRRAIILGDRFQWLDRVGGGFPQRVFVRTEPPRPTLVGIADHCVRADLWRGGFAFAA